MARPKSEAKRRAILEAAARVIAAEGLGAPIAAIANEARVSNGLLFIYFETKAELFNQLYLDMKGEMAAAALRDLPSEAPLRETMRRLWSNWTGWAAANPHKRRALAQLQGCLELTGDTRAAAHRTMAGVADLMGRLRPSGALGEARMEFIVAIVNALTETTMDFILNDPAHAEQHSDAGFELLWRAFG